jgi:uncharacterized HAD superfamily protein
MEMIMLKFEIVVKDINYNEIIDSYITKESTGIKILKTVIKKCPPKLKNEMVVIYISTNKMDLIRKANQYTKKNDIPIRIVDIDAKSISK